MLRMHMPGSPDDEYMMRVHPHCDAVSMYCYSMQGGFDFESSMLEYVPLAAGSAENFAMYYRPRLVNYDTCSGQATNDPPETRNFWGQTW